MTMRGWQSGARPLDARRKIAVWREEYNRERPHSSLGYRTPEKFAALANKNENGFYKAEAGQGASITGPLPRTRIPATGMG